MARGPIYTSFTLDPQEDAKSVQSKSRRSVLVASLDDAPNKTIARAEMSKEQVADAMKLVAAKIVRGTK